MPEDNPWDTAGDAAHIDEGIKDHDDKDKKKAKNKNHD
jgi:hypothetical protein